MAQEEGRRARKRSKNAPSYDEVKTKIDAKEKAAAERKAARSAAKKTLTPAERYEQEKAARAKKGSSGYGYSQHLMGGSGSSSSFNPRSVREEVLSYLLDEGFASDEKSAEAIMSAMSEAWIESIVEAKQEEGKSKEEKQKIRTERSGFTGPHANNERRGAHGDRDERNKDLADLRKGKKKNSSYFSYLP